ncbi:kinase-like domain-containing protein [Boletus edulis]|nr:kinase-like domain-containing protein [Boletus edulis]
MLIPERCAQRGRDLTNWVVKLHKYPVAHGGFSDVWKCTLRCKQRPPRRVAVKAIRPVFANDEEYQAKRRAIERELKVWVGLKHQNVLPLYGITEGFGPFLAFVCPWADNGTLSEYLEKFESQLDLKKRIALLGDIAAGLQYLHARNIVHGDLSSSNILITKNGKACLSDFGLSTLLEVSETAISYPGNIRWAAPELLDGYIASTEGTLASQLSSTQADIYSFGSIMLQILSGKLPFHGVHRDAEIVIMIARGYKPPREPLWDGGVIPDLLWVFVEACWESPAKRPLSEDIVHFIGCQLSRL